MDFEKLFREITEYENSLGFKFFSQPDRSLDRYANVKPYEHNRCVLPSGRYINASYVDLPNHPIRYILTQAPKLETLPDFMEMLRHERVSLVLRLGGDCLYERPSTSSSIYKCDSVPCEVLHFEDWPDHGVPSKHKFVQFHAHFQKRICALIEDSSTKPTVVVHCNAGVGRSGTLVAYDIGFGANISALSDLVGLVKQLRRYRTLLVQTPGQLEFLYEVLLETGKIKTLD